MPSLTSIPLSLSNILEARHGPLRELEIWAFLCQCAESLQDFIIADSESDKEIFRYIVIPNSLLVRDNGTVTLVGSSYNLQDSLFLPPELHNNNFALSSDTAFEKIFVYSLGKTLQSSSEYGLKDSEIVGISYDLDILLRAMTDGNAITRIGLMHIFEACELQTSQHPEKPPHTFVLSQLYKSVMSNTAKKHLNDSSYVSDQSRQSSVDQRGGRARRPRARIRHRRNSDGTAWSRSRSRSRSLSRDKGTSVDTGNKRVDTLGTNSSFLNASNVSSLSEKSSLVGAALFPPSVSPDMATQSVHGLLGFRQGSPAYQKYIQLKERQIKLRQARSGQRPINSSDLKAGFMSSTFPSQETMDVSVSKSMTSLMSFTLGSYMPDLHTQVGSETTLDIEKNLEADNLNLMLSPDQAFQVETKETELVPTEVQQMSANDAVQSFPETSVFPPKAPQRNKKTSSSSSSSQAPIPQREFYGPEFVNKLKKPLVQIAMPLQGDSVKNAAHARVALVTHLTGQRFCVTLDPSTTGRQLYDTIIPYADIDDFFFFGLTYINEGEHFFLDADTKLYKVAPEGWKEGGKSHFPAPVLKVYIRVKFYPDSLADFRHSNSYHLLYLQLRRDLIEERCTIKSDVVHQLSGLALYVEYGPYNPAIMGQDYFAVEQYYSSSRIREMGKSQAYHEAFLSHKSCASISTSQAEIEFIKHMRLLSEYGIHFYKLLKSKSQSELVVWVGLSQQSLVLAQTENQNRVITKDYPWNSILKISFNKRRFSLQPKTELARGKPPKINLYTNSFRKGRYLLQFATEQHRFQIRMRTRPSNMETITGDASVSHRPETVEAGVGDYEIGTEAVFQTQHSTLDPALQPLPEDEEEEEDEEICSTNERPVFDRPLKYQSPPPYQPPNVAQLIGNQHVFPDPSLLDMGSMDLNSDELKLLLDLGSKPHLSMDSVVINNEEEEEEERREAESPSPIPKANFSNLTSREIVEIVLIKEEPHGIGLTIVGGDATSSLDLGIFIKSLVPGGPADRDGRIQPGDRLIAVNGVSLEGKHHHVAVNLFKESPQEVKLLLSQLRPPGTIKRNKEKLQAKLRNSAPYDTSEDFEDFLHNSNDWYIPEDLLTYDDFVAQSLIQPKDYQDGDTDLIKTQDIYSPNNHFNEAITSSPLLKPSYKPKQPACQTTEQFVSEESKDLEQVLRELREDEELSFDMDRQGYDSLVMPESQEKSRLTKEDLESLNILADITALEADDLSSDSDFDTAVRNTVETVKWSAPPSLASATSPFKTYQPSTDRKPEVPNSLQQNQVVYEVILEKRNGTLGIIPELLSSSESHVVCISEILPGSSAHQGGILAPGDRILEIGGESSENLKSVEATILALDSVPDVCVVKVARSSEMDQLISQKIKANSQSQQEEERLSPAPPSAVNQKTPNISLLKPSDIPISKLISPPPKSKTPPLRDDLVIVPPPPPMLLDLEDESNTQSDVDSDVLDSSRSELERIYKNSGLDTDDTLLSLKPDNLPSSNPDPLLSSKPDPLLSSKPDPLLTSKPEPSFHKEEHPIENKVKLYNSHIKNDDKETNKNGMPEKTSFEQNLDKINKDKEVSEIKTEFTHEVVGQVRKEKVVPEFKKTEIKIIETEPVETVDKNVDTLSLEKISPSDLTVSSSSSTESVKTSPRKMLKERQQTLLRQSRLSCDNEKANSPDQDCEINNAGGLENNCNTDVDNGRRLSCASDDANVQELECDNDIVQFHEKCVGVSDPPDSGNNPVADKIDSKNSEDTTEPTMFEVELQKKSVEGFGFTVVGGVDTGGCFVKQLLSGPASTDGRIRPGDKILKINERDATRMSHVEAVTLLREEPNHLVLHLLRYPQSSDIHRRLLDMQKPVAVIGNSGETVKAGKAEVELSESKLGSDSKQTLTTPAADKERQLVHNSESAGVMRVKLVKPDNSPTCLGLSLELKEQDGQSGVFVRKLRPGGAADGQLKVGDRLLQANGISLLGLTQKEAVQILRDAEEFVQLTITRPCDSDTKNVTTEAVSTTSGEETQTGLVKNPPSDVSIDGSADNFRSCRTLTKDVPVLISADWLRELPLIDLSFENSDAYAREMLQTLVNVVEREEPQDEYKTLRQMKEQDNCQTGKLTGNKPRNRYRNVLPYDSNRVKLEQHENDYINASKIELSVGEHHLRYIATQAPTVDSTNIFWQMVWQEGSRVIVMLTSLVENGKVKCHRYWPESAQDDLLVTDEHGVECLCVCLTRSYSVDCLHLKHLSVRHVVNGEERDVLQIQFTSWPDSGVPETALPLMKLLRVMHLLERQFVPVVHCSAGIGRTGTIIAIDAALAFMEQNIKVNIYDIVESLRNQRYGMVQTTDQYLFCYTACMEALLSVEME